MKNGSCLHQAMAGTRAPVFTPVFALVFTLVFAATSSAQVAAPNSTGVSMGHLHYNVDDIDAEIEFWLKLGGRASSIETVEAVIFPNVIVVIGTADASGGTEGSVLNHVAFRVESLADIEARGLELHLNEQFPGIASVYSPSGERIELFDDQLATNIGFELDDGHVDPVAERHNQPLAAPIVSHHMHFYLPEDQVEAAQTWYVDHFGASPGTRWRYLAADLPGMNLNFSARETPQAPTAGRTLDHIGFEVENLAEFCRSLEGKGIVFDVPFWQSPSGNSLATLTDPWGTRIQLTEGLSEL